jgi:non-homologous end joining protein Ku
MFMAGTPRLRFNQRGTDMTAYELYEALDKAGIDFEIVEIEDGLRVISIMVDEVSDEELTEEMTDEEV